MLGAVIRSVRAIHAGPSIPSSFPVFRIVEDYRAIAAERGVVTPPAFDEVHARAGDIEAALSAHPLANRPCHNDLLNANFLLDGDHVWIVDYEYGGMGDLFFDLGNLSINNGLSSDAQEMLLRLYFGDVTDAHRGRLQLMRIMSDFREAMWGVVQQAISTLDFDYVDYAGPALHAMPGDRVGRPVRRVAPRGRGGARLDGGAVPGDRDRRRRRRREHRVPPHRARVAGRAARRPRRADVGLHVPLGGPGRTAALERLAHPDDDVQRRALPAAGGRDRRRPRMARGRFAPARVQRGADAGAPAAGGLGAHVRAPARGHLHRRGARAVPAVRSRRGAGRGVHPDRRAPGSEQPDARARRRRAPARRKGPDEHAGHVRSTCGTAGSGVSSRTSTDRSRPTWW